MRHTPLLSLILLLLACNPDEPTEDATDESFDRAAMLEHWADNVILPAFTDFHQEATHLRAAAQAYTEQPDNDGLNQLREAFDNAYLEWQRVSPYMTGPGEELRLREQLNLYPTDTALLLSDANINYELPSNVDAQGFPALDYLLYGVAEPEVYRERILRLTNRIAELSGEMVERWKSYRDDYVAATGNSATGSIDRTVNDYIFYYEKHLRAGKVGIPAGVFSSRPLPRTAEAPYHGALSKTLLLAALDNTEHFFTANPGLKEYLDALAVRRDGQPLSQRIEDNFAEARRLAGELDHDFATQVRAENTAMLRLYDALQANVILLKVDMLQALSINVDYVDADGD